MAAAVGPLRVTLEDLSTLPAARHSFAEWLGKVPVGETVASDLVTAAGELCANALRAAHSKAELCARVEAMSVVVDVTDDGEGMECGVPEEPPPPYEEAGRGLFVVRALVDVLWISRRPNGGTRATFARRLTP